MEDRLIYGLLDGGKYGGTKSLVLLLRSLRIASLIISITLQPGT